MTPPRAERADAVRNRARVLRAAEAVFAEKGPGAGMDEVALRAGVGKATVYRSWTTKEDLLAAVASAHLTWLAGVLRDRDPATDAGTAFRDLGRLLAQRHAADALLSVAVAMVAGTGALQAERDACRTALERLIADARAQGALRTDAGLEQWSVLFRGVARELVERGVTDPVEWARYADLVTDAMRPVPPSSVPTHREARR